MDLARPARGLRSLRQVLGRRTVTVVVPAFDVAPYLDECLDSVVSEGCVAQVVVVDDGSTDGTAELADNWAGRDTRVEVVHQANRGPGAGGARNVGLDRATGEFVLFLDGDDRLIRGGLDRLVKALAASGDELAVGALKAFPEGRRWPWDSVFADAVEPWSAPIEEVSALVHNPAPGNKLFRRRALERYGLRFAEGIHHQDTLVTVPLLLRTAAVTVVPHVVQEYRVRPGSVMSSHYSRKENFFDHLYVVEQLVGLGAGLTPARRVVLDAFLARSMQGFILRGPDLPVGDRDEFFSRAREVYLQVDLSALLTSTRSAAHRRAYSAVIAGDANSWEHNRLAPPSRVWARSGRLYSSPPGTTVDPLHELGPLVSVPTTLRHSAGWVELHGRAHVVGADVLPLDEVRLAVRLKGAGLELPAITTVGSAAPRTGLDDGLTEAQPVSWTVRMKTTDLPSGEHRLRMVLTTPSGPVSSWVRWPDDLASPLQVEGAPSVRLAGVKGRAVFSVAPDGPS